MRLEQDHVEALDPAVLLAAAVEADPIVEHLERAFLPPCDRRAPTDEQHPVSHPGSSARGHD